MVEGEFVSAQYPRANMVAHVAGQAESTQDAERRHLRCFLHSRKPMSGQDDARGWHTSVAEAFLKELARGNISRLSSTGAPHVRPRPPAAPSCVTRLGQSALEIPGSPF
jgi:hypothetical protein